MGLSVEMANAIAALKLKGRFRLVPAPRQDGIIVEQPAKPDLLLTESAAIRFCREREEAENA